MVERDTKVDRRNLTLNRTERTAAFEPPGNLPFANTRADFKVEALR